MGHLWYLSALIYVYAVFNMAYVFHVVKIAAWIGVALLPIAFFVGNYAWLLGIMPAGIWTRNFLMTGIPYFSIGLLIWDRRIHLLSSDFHRKKWMFSVGIVVLTLLSIIEKDFLVNKTGISIMPADTYFITPLFASFLFMFAWLKDAVGFGMYTTFEKVLSYIGRVLSAEIYLLHPLIIRIVGYGTQRAELPEQSITYKVLPVIVYWLTMIIIIIKNIFIGKMGGNNDARNRKEL